MEAISIIFNLIFTVIGAILSVFIGKLIRQNGRVLNEMDKGFRIMSEKMSEGFRMMGEKMDQGFRKMDENAAQRHSEVIELIAAIKKSS